MTNEEADELQRQAARIVAPSVQRIEAEEKRAKKRADELQRQAAAVVAPSLRRLKP